MKKKILLSVCFILIGCFLGTTIGELKYRNMNEKKEYSEEILLEYGDKFPLDKFKKLEKDNKENEDIYNIILYVDPYCDSCIENYIVVERMYKILSKEKIGVKIIWKQKPKEKAIDNIDVPKENQYMVRNTNLLNEYPLFFITDKNSKVLMMTDNISKVMKKILELEEINRDKISESSNIYLEGLIDNPDRKKPSLIYFAMEGCPDCESAMEILTKNSILDHYNIQTIYTKDSYGEKEFVDSGDFFMSIYGIDWYPSFLILKENEHIFIGQKTEQELVGILQKLE